MQTLIDLVSKLGIPVSVAVAMVVIAYLWKYNETRRDRQDEKRDKQDELSRESWAAAVKIIQESHARSTEQITRAMSEMVSELKEIRRGRSGR